MRLLPLPRTRFQRSLQTDERKKLLQAERARLAKTIEQLIDKIGDLTNPSVIAALEKRIGTLEQEKLVIEEKIESSALPARSFESALRTVLHLIGNPSKLWDSGEFEHKRLLLRMIFVQPMQWARNEGFRTADLALPFKLLSGFSASKERLVEGVGFEPTYV